tara:strand:+ start:1000 stop:1773 length:774 start_codon:yes stop_codon:yes gene_type:complete
MADNQYAFPTETLSLPSQGLLYPKGSPLSSGTIDVKYMTAKEEDILTSTNLIEKGVVIDRLLESVIADPKVKLDDMLIGDKNALMLGTRVLGYGKEYDVVLTDPDTGLEVEHTFDLTQIETVKIDDKLLKSGNNFELELPISKRTITFKLLTHRDEREIETELEGYRKLSATTGVTPELTTRLKKQITSVDGNKEKQFIDNFVVNEFLAQDTKAYREYLKKVTPDVVFEQEYTSQIGEPHKVDIPVGVRFFWPESKL